MSLRTDLALARKEIRELRLEGDRLRERLRLRLGAELDQIAQTDMVQRIQELTRQNQNLLADLDQTAVNKVALQQRVSELEDDLTAARQSLRRVVRSHNTAGGGER